MEDLLQSGANIRVYDPEATRHFKTIFTDRIHYADNMYEALDGVDALAIVTEWNVFRSPDYNEMKSRMNEALIFDGRNIFDHDKMRELGFHYYSMGRH